MCKYVYAILLLLLLVLVLVLYTCSSFLIYLHWDCMRDKYHQQTGRRERVLEELLGFVFVCLVYFVFYGLVSFIHSFIYLLFLHLFNGIFSHLWWTFVFVVVCFSFNFAVTLLCANVVGFSFAYLLSLV